MRSACSRKGMPEAELGSCVFITALGREALSPGLDSSEDVWGGTVVFSTLHLDLPEIFNISLGIGLGCSINLIW